MRSALKYSDGASVRLGDRVQLGKEAYGEVVCSIDTDEYSKNFPRSEWSYLSKGVLVDSPQAGLIYYPEPDDDLTLLRRTIDES